MSGPERELTHEELAETAALSLGRTVLGRDLTSEESEARHDLQVVRSGPQTRLIRRLAEQVVAERTDESVEEFFEDVIHPD